MNDQKNKLNKWTQHSWSW